MAENLQKLITMLINNLERENKMGVGGQEETRREVRGGRVQTMGNFPLVHTHSEIVRILF